MFFRLRSTETIENRFVIKKNNVLFLVSVDLFPLILKLITPSFSLKLTILRLKAIPFLSCSNCTFREIKVRSKKHRYRLKWVSSFYDAPKIELKTNKRIKILAIYTQYDAATTFAADIINLHQSLLTECV